MTGLPASPRLYLPSLPGKGEPEVVESGRRRGTVGGRTVGGRTVGGKSPEENLCCSSDTVFLGVKEYQVSLNPATRHSTPFLTRVRRGRPL